VLARNPDYPHAKNYLARALVLTGRPDEALRYFGPESGYLGYVYAVTGRRAEAEAIAATTYPAYQVLIYGALRDKERAYEALYLLVDRNPWRAATRMIQPEVDIIRDDPRFGEIRRRLLRIPN
jgi:hypothetical protein